MFCIKCGREIKDDALFCPYCGNSNSMQTVETEINSKAVQMSSGIMEGKYDINSIDSKKLKIAILLLIALSILLYFISNICINTLGYDLSESRYIYPLNAMKAAKAFVAVGIFYMLLSFLKKAVYYQVVGYCHFLAFGVVCFAIDDVSSFFLSVCYLICIVLLMIGIKYNNMFLVIGIIAIDILTIILQIALNGGLGFGINLDFRICIVAGIAINIYLSKKNN